MRRSVMIAFGCAVALALAPAAAVSKGKGNGHGSMHSSAKFHGNHAGLRGLARADASAGTHGLRGRNNARLHGANRTDFCPPGQAKKPGLGSRFAC